MNIPGCLRSSVLALAAAVVAAALLGLHAPRPAHAQVASDLWRFTRAELQEVPTNGMVTSTLSQADPRGGRVSVRIKGANAGGLPGGVMCEGGKGELTIDFGWTVKSGDSDGIATLSAGETFSIEFSARFTAVPPCSVAIQLYAAWIDVEKSWGTQRPDFGCTLFPHLKTAGRFYATAPSVPPHPFHNAAPRAFTTAPDCTVNGPARGAFSLAIYAEPYLPAAQIFYLYEPGSGPPVVDGGAEARPGEVRLGGLDLASYCRSIGAMVVLGNDRLWYCQQGHDRYSPIDMNRACQWQYNDPTALARQTAPNNPQTWVCYGGEVPPQRTTVPLKLFWSAQRGDNQTTATDQAEQDAVSWRYVLVRTEGYLLPNQEPDTVPLKLYWNAPREDNFTTATAEGERDAMASGYGFARVEGYVFRSQQPGTVPLKLFWSAQRGDNFTTATAAGEQSAVAAGYQFVRVEGYIFPQP